MHRLATDIMDTNQYKEFFEQASVASVVVDTDFTIVAASDAYLNITKHVREDIVGRNIFEVFPDNPNDATADGESNIRASFDRVIKNKTSDTLAVVRYDIPRPGSEGGGFVVKYWQPIHSPVFDEHHQVKYVVQNVLDVTENEALIDQLEVEKKTLKSIEESNTRYNMMLMQSPFAFSIMKGEDFVVVLANDLMKEFWGKGNNVEGKTLLQILPELKDQPFPEMIRKVLSTGIPIYANEILARLERHGKMEDLYFNVVYQPHHEADGSISGVVTIVYDVTEMVLARIAAEESEYRYRTLIEEATVATALFLGPEIRVQYANDIMLGYWGKDKSIIGKPLSEALPELEGQPFLQYFKDVYHSGKQYTGVEERAELVINGKLETFYFNFTYKALRDRAGNIYGIHEIAVDVTNEVLAKKSLEASEKRFQGAVAAVKGILWTNNASGEMEGQQTGWASLTGQTYDEYQGYGWAQAIHPDDAQPTLEAWNEAVAERKNFVFEHRLRSKDGDWRHFSVEAIPLLHSDGFVQEWVGVHIDITEQKRYEEELERAVAERTKELAQANKELAFQNSEKSKRADELVIANKELTYQSEEKERHAAELIIANKELELFVHISSHDLQEPLRKLQIAASRIEGVDYENISANGKEQFSRMKKAAHSMQTLIEDILTYATTNKEPTIIERSDLNTIIEEVTAQFQEIIDEKHATIDTTELCEVKVIPFHFRQLMHNLIGNALKFSSPERPPHISIKSHNITYSKINKMNLIPGKEYCHITVADNGIGFEPQYGDKIFEVFQRLHGKDQYKGTGIGLAIVKKIVESQDGVITATGVLGKGAAFEIYIPTH